MRLLRFIRRFLLVTFVLLVVLVVAGGAWVATHRDEARAWQQVTTIGAHLADIGALNPIGDALAHDTTDARKEQVAALPATIITPDDDDEHPAIMLLVPAGTDGAEERRIRDAQRAIAAAGMAAWTVRVPGSQDALSDANQLDQLAASIEVVSTHSSTQDDHVSVIAIGPTASLALRLAARDQLRGVISGVVAVQPIADVRGLVGLATTGSFVDRAGRVRRADISPELRASAGRAVIMAVREEIDGTPVLDTLLDAAEGSDDPLAALRLIPPATAGPDLKPVLELLATTTPAQFDSAWERLPEPMRTAADARSPLPVASRISARVLLVQATDEAWARTDVERLEDAIPDSETLRIDAEDPGAIIEDPRAVHDALSLSAWWLRRAGT